MKSVSSLRPASMPTPQYLPRLPSDVAEQVRALWWPRQRLGEALVELGRHTGWRGQAVEGAEVAVSAVAQDPVDTGRWLVWAADQLGLEAEPVETALGELPHFLRQAGPAVLAYHDEQRGEGFLLLLSARWGTPRLLGPDLHVHSCGVAVLRTALCWDTQAPLIPELSRLLNAAQVPASRRGAVQEALLQQRLSQERFSQAWLLRLPASARMVDHAQQLRLPQRLLGMLGLFALMYGLEVSSWALMGGAVLEGRLDMGWLSAWLLLTLSMAPLHAWAGWLNASFALDAGRVLKARLLAGALNLDVDTVQRQGVGHLLGRVIETQALESLAFSGGMAALVALLELGFAGWVLWSGAGGGWHLGLLLLWLLVAMVLGWRYFKAEQAWTAQRVHLTHDLVERMVGHRTRLTQERPGRRDRAEDQALDSYQERARHMDQASVWVLALIPKGWQVLGLVGLLPALASGNASMTAVAVSLGGFMLAQRALGSVVSAWGGLGRAVIAWQQVSVLFLAGGQRAAQGVPFLPRQQWQTPDPNKPLIDAHGLQFGYRPGAPILRDATLSIRHGERVLLEGSSGGGKSTLAALLTGLRQPQKGLLLLNGLDRYTLGDLWHRLATSAPQFNENHIFSGTLAFNLLLGRQWPPSPEDLAEARAMCEALGLSELLERMPAGLMQQVGETGWQLSHGERSRIFLARALLQEAPLTILDESFAALDPQTLTQCLQCAWQRAKTLVVIAHP